MTTTPIGASSPLAIAMQQEAADLAAAHPHVQTATTPIDWERTAAEFGLSAVMWHALADSAMTNLRPEYGHLAGDFGERIADLYRRMAQIAESYQDTAREIAYADAHPHCEDDYAEVGA